MMKVQKRNGFSWSLGGLLGAALGCSAWMVLTPFVAGWHSAGVFAALGCALVIMLAVPVLWRMRTRLEALQGMFIFLAVAFLATSSFLLCAHFMELPLLMSWPASEQAEAASCFWILAIFPALALVFWLVSRSGKTNSESTGDGQDGSRSLPK